jgi:hypothetical protein
MANVSAFVKQLKQERDRVERQLSVLNAALSAFAGVYGGNSPAVNGGGCQQRVGPRSAAHRARWAKFRKSAKK